MNENENDKAPLFKTWRAWYVAVLLFLVIQIVLFLFLTNYFS